jgi:hypothetical protein
VEDTKLFVSHRFAKKLVAAKVGGAGGAWLRCSGAPGCPGCPLVALLVTHHTACKLAPHLPAQAWQFQLMSRRPGTRIT